MAAGIDDIAVYIPKLYVDMREFADARGIEPAKLEKGIGTRRMSLPDTNQDSACLAANAVFKLMEKNNLQPNDVERLYVSTESSFDESKAMNSYVIGMLEQPYGEESFEHCGGVETKFACVSGSYALYDNTNWIRSGEAEGKNAIVVVTDIAQYDLKSSGESTQGAGAVAMLLNDNPRIISFDPKVTSTSIKDEYDFYRPFGKDTPIVHGQYSNLLYLIQISKALETYKRKARKTGLIVPKKDETVLDYIDFLNVHIPYRSMGKKALAHVLRHEWRPLSRWKNIEEKIGPEPEIPEDVKKEMKLDPGSRGTIEAILGNEDYMKADHSFMKSFMNTDEFRNDYENKMESSLESARHIGNMYTASLYMSFRSALEEEFKKGTNLDGKRFGFGSYGSGASAMIFSGVIQPEYESVVGGMNIKSEVGHRRKLTMEEYENIRNEKLDYRNSILNGKGGGFIIENIDESIEKQNERKYVFVK